MQPLPRHFANVDVPAPAGATRGVPVPQPRSNAAASSTPAPVAEQSGATPQVTADANGAQVSPEVQAAGIPDARTRKIAPRTDSAGEALQQAVAERLQEALHPGQPLPDDPKHLAHLLGEDRPDKSKNVPVNRFAPKDEVKALQGELNTWLASEAGQRWLDQEGGVAKLGGRRELKPDGLVGDWTRAALAAKLASEQAPAPSGGAAEQEPTVAAEPKLDTEQTAIADEFNRALVEIQHNTTLTPLEKLERAEDVMASFKDRLPAETLDGQRKQMGALAFGSGVDDRSWELLEQLGTRPRAKELLEKYFDRDEKVRLVDRFNGAMSAGSEAEAGDALVLASLLREHARDPQPQSIKNERWFAQTDDDELEPAVKQLDAETRSRLPAETREAIEKTLGKKLEDVELPTA